MNKINDGGPAFPQWDGHAITSEPLYLRGGMSLRDWLSAKFAAAWVIALSHRCAIHEGEPGYGPVGDADMAKEANRLGLIQADAMLAEREKE